MASAFEAAFVGWWQGKGGDLKKAVTAGRNTTKLEAMINKRGAINLAPSSEAGTAEKCMAAVHSTLIGRVYTTAQATFVGATHTLRSSGDGSDITTSEFEAKHYGHRMVPMHRKLVVAVTHTDHASEPPTMCEVYGYVELLPLFKIIEAKVVHQLASAVSEMEAFRDMAKRMRATDATAIATPRMQLVLEKNPTSLEAIAEAYFDDPGEKDVDRVGVAIAFAMRCALLHHLSTSDGGDRFKDRRGVQAMFDEYHAAIQQVVRL